jgi:hypothetical protein
MVLWLAAAAAIWIGSRRAVARPRLVLAARTLVVAGVVGRAAYLAGAIALAAPASGIAIFPATLTFGTQTISTTAPTQVLYVTNIGADTLNFTSITPAGDFSDLTNCGTSLGPAASCTIVVSFTPTATGVRSGSITILDDAPGSPHTVNLAGTGQNAPTSNGGTPSGSYALTIAGTSGTLLNYGTLTVTVQ